MKNYVIIDPEFWSPSARHSSLPATVKLTLLYLTATSDKDGIAPIPEGFTKMINKEFKAFSSEDEAKILNMLQKFGCISIYQIGGVSWAWLPDRSSQQPSRGNYAAKRKSSLPPPPKEAVFKLLKRRLHRDPSEKEMKQISPRTFKSSRSSSGIVETDVTAIFEEWRKRQINPDRCICSQPVQARIRSALQQASVQDLVDLIRFAYESDHPAAKFWQGHNEHKRKYLGLDNLLRPSKIQDRLQFVYEWISSDENSGQVKSDLGFLAKFRGTASRQNPEPERMNSQRGKIINFLKQRGEKGASTSELAGIALRYGARISELRNKGYDIQIKKSDDGNNTYILKNGGEA